MKLTEYLNQQEPQRMPHVVLSEDEYRKHLARVDEFHNPVYLVEIIDKDFCARFPSINSYLLVGTSLYVIDGAGNAKKRSCFNITNK